jgi:hypothetical protein
MIVDFRVRVPLRDSDSDPRLTLADIYPNPEDMARYQDIYGLEEIINTTTETLLHEMAEAKVDKAVIHAEYECGGYKSYHHLNKRVAKLIQLYPEKFVGIAGVDPRDGMIALREFERAVREDGLKGLNLQVPFQGLSAIDRRCYPFYAKCVELGVPVAIHVGVHFDTAFTITQNNPVLLDEIACDFPDLKIVGLHGGWPWVLELIAVARRHKNVYLEYGAIAPRYLAMPKAGWEPVMQFGNTVLQEQLLFGTDWPTIRMPRAISEFQQLEFKGQVKEKILAKNAMKLLGLTE